MEKERMAWFLDDKTGFPLPLVPYGEAPEVRNKDGSLYHTDPDYHHFFFPKRSFLVENSADSSTLVRVSRAQRVRRFYHMRAHNLLAPPEITIDPKTSLHLATLALSNYVPSTAIDLRPSQPRTIELSSQQYDKLRQSTSKGFESKIFSFGAHERAERSLESAEAIATFLLRTMIEVNHELIDEELRCQLLEASHDKRRNDLANQIANLIIYHSVEPINPIVEECKKTGEIPDNQPSPFRLISGITKQVDRTPVVHEAIATLAA